MLQKILCWAFCVLLGSYCESEMAGSGNPTFYKGRNTLILSFSGSRFRSQCKVKSTTLNTPSAIQGWHLIPNYSFWMPIPQKLCFLLILILLGLIFSNFKRIEYVITLIKKGKRFLPRNEYLWHQKHAAIFRYVQNRSIGQQNKKCFPKYQYAENGRCHINQETKRKLTILNSRKTKAARFGGWGEFYFTSKEVEN